MNLQEQLKHAEEMWKAALDKNELYDVMYWRGMVDGLKAKQEKTEYRHVMEEITRAKMEEDA